MEDDEKDIYSFDNWLDLTIWLDNRISALEKIILDKKEDK